MRTRQQASMASGITSAESESFASHCAWVRSLRESYDSIRESRRESAREAEQPVDFFSGAAEETPALAAAFDQILDFQEFEEPPVYRGLQLSDTYLEHAAEDYEVGHAPVCHDRSLALESDEPMDAEWLQTMPPLVHRQSACVF